MEKAELIRQRDFSDKCNELTDYVLENFSTLRIWILSVLVPAALIYSLLAMQSSLNEVMQWGLQLISTFAIVTFAVVQNTYVAESFASGKELKEIKLRLVFSKIVRNVGQSLFVLFLPIVVFSVISFFLNSLDTSATNRFILGPARLQLMIVSVIITSLLSLPLCHITNAIVFGTLKGGDAVKRGLRITFDRFIFSVIYIVVITALGIILPEILSIPSFFFEEIDKLFSVSFEIEEAHFLSKLMECITGSIVSLSILVQMLFMSLAMVFDYGDVVDRLDNVTFLKKVENFENL